jgi:hypothetical protein
MASPMQLNDDQRFALALLLELEEDFPGCLDELASLPAGSALGAFVRKTVHRNAAEPSPDRKRA